MIGQLRTALDRAPVRSWGFLLVGLALAHGLVLWVGAPLDGLSRSLCRVAGMETGANPERALCGVDAAATRAFLRAVREAGLEGRGVALVLAHLPLIVATTLALAALARVVARGSPVGQRTAVGLTRLPFGYALADLAEDGLFLALYLGADAPIPILPWAIALKFGLLFASLLSSLVVFAAKVSLAGD